MRLKCRQDRKKNVQNYEDSKNSRLPGLRREGGMNGQSTEDL